MNFVKTGARHGLSQTRGGIIHPSSYIQDRLGIPNCSDGYNHLIDSKYYHGTRILEIRRGEWGSEPRSSFYLTEKLSTSSGSWISRM